MVRRWKHGRSIPLGGELTGEYLRMCKIKNRTSKYNYFMVNV